jgi:hypothetical protein
MIEQGQRWTFVHSAGDRSEYVVEQVEPPDVAGARVRLRNVETGGVATVTWDWLLNRRGAAYWERAEDDGQLPPNDGQHRPEPLVVFHLGSGAVIGPCGAWQKGDRVTIPSRGPKHGDKGLTGFDGIVSGVALDGLARVVTYVEEEMAA